MERYEGVHGKANVEAIARALKTCGARILRAPNPNVAPFEFQILTPDGETIDLVCYAFTANRYRQSGRPKDEHRFQVKYGSDFQRYHELFVDPARKKVTLMFGWHEQKRLFIAVDPMMHTPTWFSMSVEFKEAELRQAKRAGWHGWERERSAAGRRKREMPNASFMTEAVLALTPKNFLRYVALERIASGMDPGERLLLVDRIEKQSSKGEGPTPVAGHPLERQLGLSASEILDVLGGSFRLLVAVRGSVAEHHLEQQLRRTKGIEEVVRIDEDGKPDFEVAFAGRRFLIECKNVLRRSTKAGPKVDFQKTRAAKGDPCSRYYKRDQFHVLAACLHPVNERWEFTFVPTASLPVHGRCKDRISDKILVTGPAWKESLTAVLGALAAG
jgi:hypothetical protein